MMDTGKNSGGKRRGFDGFSTPFPVSFLSLVQFAPEYSNYLQKWEFKSMLNFFAKFLCIHTKVTRL